MDSSARTAVCSLVHVVACACLHRAAVVGEIILPHQAAHVIVSLQETLLDAKTFFVVSWAKRTQVRLPTFGITIPISVWDTNQLAVHSGCSFGASQNALAGGSAEILNIRPLTSENFRGKITLSGSRITWISIRTRIIRLYASGLVLRMGTALRARTAGCIILGVRIIIIRARLATTANQALAGSTHGFTFFAVDAGKSAGCALGTPAAADDRADIALAFLRFVGEIYDNSVGLARHTDITV